MKVKTYTDSKTGKPVITIYDDMTGNRVNWVAELSDAIPRIGTDGVLRLLASYGGEESPWSFHEWMDCDLTTYTTGIAYLLDFVSAACEHVGIFNVQQDFYITRGVTPVETVIQYMATEVGKALAQKTSINAIPVNAESDGRDTTDCLLKVTMDATITGLLIRQLETSTRMLQEQRDMMYDSNRRSDGTVLPGDRGGSFDDINKLDTVITASRILLREATELNQGEDYPRITLSQ